MAEIRILLSVANFVALFFLVLVVSTVFETGGIYAVSYWRWECTKIETVGNRYPHQEVCKQWSKK